MLAKYIPSAHRAHYEAQGWKIVQYNHHFLKGVLALKECPMTYNEEAAKRTEDLLHKRQTTHGDPRETLELAGNLITNILMMKHEQHHVIEVSGEFKDCHVLPHEVAIINILHKIARIQCGTFTPDHWDDICGYAQLGKELHKQLTDTCQEG